MSGELRKLEVFVQIRGSDRLPDGMCPDDVYQQVREVVQAATDAWYAERGAVFLKCAPDVG